jgi:hypothetical protein
MSRSVEAQKLSLGVLSHSRKANERRLPVHPAHLHRIDHRVSQRMYLEHGYGERYGVAGCDALMTLEWVHHHENLAISGASGTGKSHFVEALAQAAIEADRGCRGCPALSGDCRTPTNTRSSERTDLLSQLLPGRYFYRRPPVVVHAGGHSGFTTAELMTCRARTIPSAVSERFFGPPTLRGPSPAP